MSIEIGTETVLSLTEAAKIAPGRPHLATIWRWCQRGVRGVKLETIVVGGRRFTTTEALERFIARTKATSGVTARRTTGAASQTDETGASSPAGDCGSRPPGTRPKRLKPRRFYARESAMQVPTPSRRDFLSIAALNPVDGATCEVLVSYDRMQAVGRRSMGHAKECGLIVPAILQQPTAVFEGLRRDEDEDRQAAGWRCYCGVPAHAYLEDGTAIRPYPGQIYLVFVNEDAVAYNWRWEKADADDPVLPSDYRTRFKRQLL